MAKKCFEKGFDDPGSKYYQMSVQQIVESWDAKASESCHYGSMLDDYIGLNLNGKFDELEKWKFDHSYDYDMRLQGLCNGFDQFYKILKTKTDYEYITREEKMFIKSVNDNVINGRFDCLFYSPSQDRFLIIDWKSSGTIDKENKWEKMLGPLYDKDACNGNEYSVQLLMYKKALSETYGLTTDDKIDTYICQMSPEINACGANYQIHKTMIDYNTILLSNIIEFAYKKKEIEEKI